jgi:hypothetical protein
LPIHDIENQGNIREKKYQATNALPPPESNSAMHWRM